MQSRHDSEFLHPCIFACYFMSSCSEFLLKYAHFQCYSTLCQIMTTAFLMWSIWMWSIITQKNRVWWGGTLHLTNWISFSMLYLFDHGNRMLIQETYHQIDWLYQQASCECTLCCGGQKIAMGNVLIEERRKERDSDKPVDLCSFLMKQQILFLKVQFSSAFSI